MSMASQLMLFAEDFPAKTYPLREKAQELKESVAAYGQSLPDSLASYDPDTQSWRTSQHCFIEGLTVFSETFPRSGMMRNGTAYRLPPLVPLTDATESGLWPTPATKEYGHAAEGMVSNLIKKIQNGETTKEEAEQMLSLPNLENHRTWKKLWPTPDANMGMRGVSKNLSLIRPSGAKRQISLNDVIGGKLNPTWVEWLMGFPVEWTDLNNSETP
jgi:hypothetical protein